jgi:hypothetical protein
MIGLQGIRVNSVALSREADGKLAVTGEYGLISTTEVELAKSSFGPSYQSFKYTPSPATQAAMSALQAAIKADISTTLGFEVTP